MLCTRDTRLFWIGSIVTTDYSEYDITFFTMGNIKFVKFFFCNFFMAAKLLTNVFQHVCLLPRYSEQNSNVLVLSTVCNTFSTVTVLLSPF